MQHHSAANGARVPRWRRCLVLLSSALCGIACDRATAYDAAASNDEPSPATRRITDAAATAAVQPLCDGSPDIRFVSVTSSGWPSTAELFAGKYGNRLITIDGQCNFWLYDHGPRGLRTGTLDPDAASRLPEELQLGRFSILGEYVAPTCADVGTMTLTDTTGRLVTGCGVSEDVPPAWLQAVTRADRLFDELNGTSEPVWQPIRILPLADARPPTNEPVAAWTAPFDLGAIAVAPDQGPSATSADAGFLLEDEAALALLTELRLARIERLEREAESGPPGDLTPAGLFVRDQRGDDYQLLYRDEPPDPVKTALRATVLPP